MIFIAKVNYRVSEKSRMRCHPLFIFEAPDKEAALKAVLEELKHATNLKPEEDIEITPLQQAKAPVELLFKTDHYSNIHNI